MQWQKGLMVLLVLLMLVGLGAQVASANVGGRPTGGKMPLSQFFADLYEEGVGTYIPVLAFIIVITSVLNWHFGWIGIGEGLGKMILSIAILAGGVSYIIGLIGSNAAGAVLH